MDKMRWRYGDTNPVIAAVAADTVIEIGDIVWQDWPGPSDDIKPAEAFSTSQYQAHEDASAAFTRLFLGIAMQRSRAGDTGPIRVATTGVFELDCDAQTFRLGDLVGAAGNQDIVPVANAKYAIGRIARRAACQVKSALVDIRSGVMYGGVYARE